MINFALEEIAVELNWLHSLLYGLTSGLTDILPVSAQAHQTLLLKFLGIKAETGLIDVLVHFAIFAALYYSCQSHLLRMNRARALSRIPKKKRKRPLDVHSMMDWRLLKTMVIPGILGLFLIRFTISQRSSLSLTALFLLLNGLILYIPQFLPGSNKDSRTLSRVEGLLMGLGGTLSILPGFSAVGAAASIGSVCGVDRGFALNMVLMMNMVLNLGLGIYDLMNLNMAYWSVSLVFRAVLAAVAAFVGAMLAIRLLRQLIEHHGYSLFGIYCWGLALFTFILNLVV